MEDLRPKTFFISSRWRNKGQVKGLTEKIRELGLKVFSFLEYHPNQQDVLLDPEEVMRKFESRMQDDEMVRRLSALDLEHIKKADVVILLLPAGISAHMEIGYAYGLGKECILIGEPEKTETTYCMFSRSYKTIEEFISSLKKEN
jgi:nucleoside 2-deoxyribosyltransferase